MKPFEKVPRENWTNPPDGLLEVWKSKDFLVQTNQEKYHKRITINKTTYSIRNGKPIWAQGITWDEIQEIKSIVGYSDYWAVECYPPDNQIFNIANMRHIWILEHPPEFGWHKKNHEVK